MLGLRGREPGRGGERGPQGGGGQACAQHRLTSVGGEAGPGWREAWGWQLRLWTLPVWGKERGVGKATVPITDG